MPLLRDGEFLATDVLIVVAGESAVKPVEKRLDKWTEDLDRQLRAAIAPGLKEFEASLPAGVRVIVAP